MDLEALVTDELRDELRAYTLEWFDVEASTRRPPHATVVDPHARRRGGAAATSPATARSTRSSAPSTPPPRREARLREFRIDAVTGGQDALGEASVVLELAGQSAGRPGRLDRHHRGGRARLRARALQRRAQGRVMAAAERSRGEPAASSAPAP